MKKIEPKKLVLCAETICELSNNKLALVAGGRRSPPTRACAVGQLAPEEWSWG
jgi:hypothetical protein